MFPEIIFRHFERKKLVSNIFGNNFFPQKLCFWKQLLVILERTFFLFPWFLETRFCFQNWRKQQFFLETAVSEARKQLFPKVSVEWKQTHEATVKLRYVIPLHTCILETPLMIFLNETLIMFKIKNS